MPRLSATAAAQPAGDALALLAPVLAGGLAEIPPDSLTAVYVLFVLIWNDELDTARSICDAVLAAARSQGSTSMVAHASCLRSMIMRRLGRWTTPPPTAGWRWTSSSRPPRRWLSLMPPRCASTRSPASATWTRPRRSPRPPPSASLPPAGSTRPCSCRRAARSGWRSSVPARRSTTCLPRGRGWLGLGHRQPGRRVLAYRRCRRARRAGRPDEAALLAGEQLALARKAGNAATLGAALCCYAATAARR